MRSSARAALERRIAAVEAEIGKLSVGVLAEAFQEAPLPVQRAILARLGALQRLQASDPAWRQNPIAALLSAIGEISPEIAGSVASKLGICSTRTDQER